MPGEGLTGMELAELCVAKYGVAYDMVCAPPIVYIQIRTYTRIWPSTA